MFCGAVRCSNECSTLSLQELRWAVADMSDRLATIYMGRKVGCWCALSVGELGPYLTQCGLGRDLPPYQVAFWSIQHVWPQWTWAENWRGLCLFWRGGELSPHLIQCGLGRGYTSLPSFILIHPTVWPQYTNVAGQDRQRSDSIGRTDFEQLYFITKW